MIEEYKNTQNSQDNYNEFTSEKNIIPTTSHLPEISPNKPTLQNYSFASYYGRKCCLLYCFFIMCSMISMFGGLILLIAPLTNKTYINNIRLDNIFSHWKRNNYSSKFEQYFIALNVISSALTINIKHFSHDPLYMAQTYYRPSIFYLNLSSNSSNNNDVSKLKQKMGILDLTNTKNVIGISKSFCLSISYTLDSNSSSLISNYTNVYKLPSCLQKKKTQNQKGFKIIPWKRVMVYNKTSSKCKRLNGIYSKSICYRYLVLNTICLELKMNANKKLVFRSGCYQKSNSTRFFKYSKLLLQQKYDFSNFSIYLRHYKDPYLILTNFSRSENVDLFQISYGWIEDIIPLSLFFGIALFICFMMIYLLMKSEVHLKLKIKLL